MQTQIATLAIAGLAMAGSLPRSSLAQSSRPVVATHASLAVSLADSIGRLSAAESFQRFAAQRGAAVETSGPGQRSGDTRIVEASRDTPRRHTVAGAVILGVVGIGAGFHFAILDDKRHPDGPVIFSYILDPLSYGVGGAVLGGVIGHFARF